MMTVLEQRFMERVPDLLHDIAGSLETIAKKQETPKYVWVFVADQAVNDDTLDTLTEVFATEEAAHKYMYDFVNGEEGELEYANKHGWNVEINEPDHYCAYEEGYYLGNHVQATIEKKELKH